MLYKNFSSMTLFFENLTLEYGDCALPWHVGDYLVTDCHIPQERDSHFVTY
jgi:hypothetical protein